MQDLTSSTSLMEHREQRDLSYSVRCPRQVLRSHIGLIVEFDLSPGWSIECQTAKPLPISIGFGLRFFKFYSLVFAFIIGVTDGPLEVALIGAAT